MRNALFFTIAAFVNAAVAVPGVDVSAVTDTVMKIRYTGGNPNSAHPAVTVTGKRLGVMATSNNVGGAVGLSGLISAYPAPQPAVNTGVAGAGYFGVHGRGNTGVQGEGTGVGVHGKGPYGVYGRSDDGGYEAIGVIGEAVGGFYNIGVYGNAWYGYENWAGYFEGSVIAHEYLTFSDERAKRNIAPMASSLDRVMRVRPRTYEMSPAFSARGKSPATHPRFGVVAQELEEVFPELVKTVTRPAVDESGKLDPTQPATEYKAVQYINLIPVLIKAIQEQQEQIEALKAQLQER